MFDEILLLVYRGLQLVALTIIVLCLGMAILAAIVVVLSVFIPKESEDGH